MSPRGGRRCPPALLALLLGLAGSRGSPECRNPAVSRPVTEGASLCLVPEKIPLEWTEMHWKRDINSGERLRILTAPRDGSASYPKGPFHGRVKFHPGNLSLCISPVRRDDNGVYWAEFESSKVIQSRCIRVSVWDPVPEPELKSQILQRDRGRCHLSVLCSSPGNVSYSWACTGDGPEPIPGQIPEPIPGQIPGQIQGQIPEPIPNSPSRLLRSLPAGADPQICLCNVSNPAGWSAARAALTCPEISGNFSLWALLAGAGAGAVGLLLLLVGFCCWWRKRRKNSREGTPGTAPEQELTVYATVGEKKPRQDPARTGEATQEGATIYAVVTPRTVEHPRHYEEPVNFTIYSTVQFDHRPSSIKRKRLDRSLVSTAYLEDNGGYRRLGFPNPAGHQRP
ncbi:natural killer cell receptor 2B4-like isoform X7 [Zonotrichia albicollis]|uniref:natural killer cell receptor 2B4-like isoform X7 n=1 Tax=Zonotrichia albicollis TaxID=44394 RepID=UPI003D80BE9C